MSERAFRWLARLVAVFSVAVAITANRDRFPFPLARDVQNMPGRLDPVRGSLSIESKTGKGTRVLGRLTVNTRVPA